MKTSTDEGDFYRSDDLRPEIRESFRKGCGLWGINEMERELNVGEICSRLFMEM